MAPPRTVLITGCSDGGLGAALAIAFHNQGHRVFATARNPSKMSHVKELGIATLVLDVLSDESVEKCVAEVSKRTGGSLDVLVNNAGAGYNMPVVGTCPHPGSTMDVLLEKSTLVHDLNR